ncbi:hypothetical protein SD77_1565 [Bacillus badius]|uniref:Uncharacterized protein n=1 Tax=Bacillus badius TaxID=1455 RepID=A0ABR5ARE8_BACBA|nr:hypothetical protein SD78_4324 [Bacillus badius]KIL77322.1 hypothetical protein SD77_1565 [Bacillus badius]
MIKCKRAVAPKLLIAQIPSSHCINFYLSSLFVIENKERLLRKEMRSEPLPYFL